MPFTILYTMLALLTLIIIFGLTWKIKGLKVAIITTGIAFIIFAVLFGVTIYAITSVMPN